MKFYILSHSSLLRSSKDSLTSVATSGAFKKLRKTIVSFVVSVCLSVLSFVRMEQLGCHWKDFHENLTRMTGTLCDHLWIFMAASGWILLRIRNVSDKSCRESQDPHFVFSNFFSRKSRLLWDNVEKYCTARQATDDYIIQRIPFAFWITKATDTYSEYIIVIVFRANSGFISSPVFCVCTYIPSLVVFNL